MLLAMTDQVRQWEPTDFRQIIKNKSVQLEGPMAFHRVRLLKKRLVMNDRAFLADKQVLPQPEEVICITLNSLVPISNRIQARRMDS